jgi:hypothetical protein
MEYACEHHVLCEVSTVPNRKKKIQLSRRKFTHVSKRVSENHPLISFMSVRKKQRPNYGADLDETWYDKTTVNFVAQF